MATLYMAPLKSIKLFAVFKNWPIRKMLSMMVFWSHWPWPVVQGPDWGPRCARDFENTLDAPCQYWCMQFGPMKREKLWRKIITSFWPYPSFTSVWMASFCTRIKSFTIFARQDWTWRKSPFQILTDSLLMPRLLKEPNDFSKKVKKLTKVKSNPLERPDKCVFTCQQQVWFLLDYAPL